jgi:ankyrin repeat protein
LIDACRQCDIVRIKKFLTSQSVNFAHPFTRDTPLHVVSCSVFSKRKQVLEILIRKGAQINVKNKDFLTPLHVAAKENLLKILRDPPSDAIDLEMQLLEASKSGDLSAEKRFITSNLRNVNCRDIDGRYSTSLHFAAGYNRIPVVGFLLKSGADKSGANVNATGEIIKQFSFVLVSHEFSLFADLWKFSPLHEAAAKGKK